MCLRVDVGEGVGGAAGDVAIMRYEIQGVNSIIPNAEDVLALQPEELAGVVLQWWNSNTVLTLNRYSWGLNQTVSGYPEQYHRELLQALMEAWVWMEREGLIAPKPGEAKDWYFITRRGRQMNNREDLESYRRSNMLPKQLLHPRIALKVWAEFMRGDYDTAVFQAFKEVEVAVRGAGGFGPNDLGADLMRKAFHEASGPLTDKNNLVVSEKQALGHLFAGAIALYKNPHSHRNVQVDAPEAVELIMLASHLMKIVDSRKPDS